MRNLTTKFIAILSLYSLGSKVMATPVSLHKRDVQVIGMVKNFQCGEGEKNIITRKMLVKAANEAISNTYLNGEQNFKGNTPITTYPHLFKRENLRLPNYNHDTTAARPTVEELDKAYDLDQNWNMRDPKNICTQFSPTTHRSRVEEFPVGNGVKHLSNNRILPGAHRIIYYVSHSSPPKIVICGVVTHAFQNWKTVDGKKPVDGGKFGICSVQFPSKSVEGSPEEAKVTTTKLSNEGTEKVFVNILAGQQGKGKTISGGKMEKVDLEEGELSDQDLEEGPKFIPDRDQVEMTLWSLGSQTSRGKCTSWTEFFPLLRMRSSDKEISGFSI